MKNTLLMAWGSPWPNYGDRLTGMIRQDGARVSITIQTEGTILNGDLDVPGHLHGVVLFAHGSGSSRHSPRNQFVARSLQQSGIATLLLDLLTEDEEREDRQTTRFRFDIDLLARRLMIAGEWLAHQQNLAQVKLGLFGASTGAAAALVVASRLAQVAAVVSRGGRTDLAGEALDRLRAPVLLIVGGQDRRILELNRLAISRMHCEKKLGIVPRATHLFEEPGALDEVAQLTRGWFDRHLGPKEG